MVWLVFLYFLSDLKTRSSSFQFFQYVCDLLHLSNRSEMIFLESLLNTHKVNSNTLVSISQTFDLRQFLALEKLNLSFKHEKATQMTKKLLMKCWWNWQSRKSNYHSSLVCPNLWYTLYWQKESKFKKFLRKRSLVFFRLPDC